MRLRLLLNLSLLLLLPAVARAQTAEDFFHSGAMLYLSNNIPKAKEIVAGGRKVFPEDVKLKKLEELLNQQQQSQSNQQQQQEEQQKQQDEKKQNQQPQPQQKSEPKPESAKNDEKKPEPKQVEPHDMTPQEAKQLLDAQKGEEQMLQFRPPEPKSRNKVVKDW